MPAEQSCARSGACGLAGEERDHIYYIPPDQTEPGPGNILNIFSNTNQNDFVIYTLRVVTMVKINVYNRKYSDKFRIVNNTSG